MLDISSYIWESVKIPFYCLYQHTVYILSHKILHKSVDLLPIKMTMGHWLIFDIDILTSPVKVCCRGS